MACWPGVLDNTLLGAPCCPGHLDETVPVSHLLCNGREVATEDLHHRVCGDNSDVCREDLEDAEGPATLLSENRGSGRLGSLCWAVSPMG